MVKKIRTSVIVIIILCLLVVGCGKNEQSVSDNTITILAILIGNHANSKKLDVQLDNKIEQVYSSFGNACIICVDGNPEAVRDRDTPGMLAGSYSPEFLEKSKEERKYKKIWEREYLNSQISRLNDYLEECSVDDPEVDTLEAFHTAVATLNEMEQNLGGNASGSIRVNKEIVVFDTGLCSTGKLNFLNLDYLKLIKNENKLENDEPGKSQVLELVDYLEAKAEIPDLSDISVTWYGMGEVEDPQPELSRLDKDNLRYIWKEILKRADARPSEANNAKADYFVEMKGRRAKMSSQYVTPVIWWEGVGNDEEEVKITEEEVGFLPNSTEYFSKEKTEQALRPYAQNLLNYGQMKVLLLGTTSGYNGGSIELSAQRAEQVKQTLIELGVPEEQMVTIGVGYHQEFCENDMPNGEFIEEIGKKNRAVSIIPLDSEKAQRALGQSF